MFSPKSAPKLVPCDAPATHQGVRQRDLTLRVGRGYVEIGRGAMFGTFRWVYPFIVHVCVCV